jgi:hypothetical protein
MTFYLILFGGITLCAVGLVRSGDKGNSTVQGHG